ncbi:hypothetical protein GGR50DRAFT_692986 [Xylaria sp. CBS 124048]|nr:hypothetical protein GGR50DRAFT_692986 [Xylaria sp. CBS 124048]
MRFTSFVVAGLFAIVANAQSSAQETGSAVASTTVSVDPAQSSEASKVEQCLAACDPSDTKCRANCIAVPSPDTQNVNATTACVAACPQGNGTAADNQSYENCVNGCISSFFFTSTGTPNLATSAAGGSSGSGSGSSGDNSATTASASVTHVPTTIVSGGSTITTEVASTASASESAQSTSSSHGAAAVYGPVGTGLGLFGLLAGFMAL